MKYDFKEPGSPEWHVERQEFEAGLYGDAVASKSDDDVVQYALDCATRTQIDPQKLDEPLQRLLQRLYYAQAYLIAKLPVDNGEWIERHGVQEALSDAGVVIECFRAMLAPYGPAAEQQITLKRRRAGASASDLDDIRRGMGLAGDVERMVDEGIKQEAAIAQVCEQHGCSRSYLMTWLRQRRAAKSGLEASFWNY